MTERLYEGLFLVDASVASQNWAELEALMTGIVTQHGGSIEYSEKWPEQRLAYEINGTKRGVYFLVYFRADTQSIVGMRNDAQLNEKIMRCLFVQETFLEEEMKRRQEVADRRSAEPEPAAAAPATEEAVAEEPVVEAAAETPAEEAAADSGESEAAEEPVAVEHDAGAGEEEEKE
ncbi:MAG: 30S ribosomal protein S6 [Planctomycetota bacterium]